IIANNLVGYTTNREEGRSTRYASDLAKGYEIPVIHVNADDPIACIQAINIAYEYRDLFKKDILIDLVGYRRYGHNEMDEPRATQPLLYSEIDQHATVANVFANRLQEDGTIVEGELKMIETRIENELQEKYDSLQEHSAKSVEYTEMPEELEGDLDHFETAVSLDKLVQLNNDLLLRSDDFTTFKRLNRMFKRRQGVLEDGKKADWGTGEALAFASIVADGTPIRLTGQDSERGTFAHRHLVLHDLETGEKYSPMHGLQDGKASFDIRNSPLSEMGVLGFEYGYSV